MIYFDRPDSQLWTSDGISADTTLVANLAGPAGSGPKEFTVLKKSLFFVARDYLYFDRLYVYGEEEHFPWSLFFPANMKKSGNP
ncbi:MAG TPA: hypothetical protein ENK96_00480 [Desulfobulbaceae bacterium]|nr:hypothetical protein [Desulfobulbaceae bacterium]